MVPPTPLAIATQSVLRLVKEESYYHKEQASQEARIQKLKADIEAKAEDLDSNAEYMLKQEQQALEETKAVFGPLLHRITEAVEKLEDMIALAESDGVAGEEELAKAKEALESGQKVTAVPEQAQQAQVQVQ